MAEYDSVLDLMTALDGAINEAMTNPMLVDYVKETLQKSIQSNVYQGYDPILYHRRRADGGLADKENMVVTNHTGGVLEIEDQASGREFEGYWGKVRADERIDDLIEAGGYSSYNVDFITQEPPGPRPFYQPADEMLDEELISEMICTNIEALI